MLSFDSHLVYPGESGLLSTEGVYGVSASRPVAPLALTIPFELFSRPFQLSWTNGLLRLAGVFA